MADNPLGRATTYISEYSPQLLFAIERQEKRNELSGQWHAIKGEDIWNAYEISWLNPQGVPQIAIGEFRFSAQSAKIIESKSLKLYLNSLNQSKFTDQQTVTRTIQADLSAACDDPVSVRLNLPDTFSNLNFGELSGESIDAQDIQIDDYRYDPQVLVGAASGEIVTETLISHLLKSNCLITSQPDWATVQIKYRGNQIERNKLLAYLVSFRSHNEFHEQCVERIFCDLKQFCKPQQLTVYARYTRRGGLDINPWRSDFETSMENIKLARQ